MGDDGNETRRGSKRHGLLRGGWALAMLGAIGVGPSTGIAQSPPSKAQLANPASQNCVARGGALHIERRADGGQFGVCVFTDNQQCEEWALMRGECPVGGLRVTGYLSAAARYCAITGGRYTIVLQGGDAATERGACALPSGKACSADNYYAGTCGR